jgi:hypothetical protein
MKIPSAMVTIIVLLTGAAAAAPPPHSMTVRVETSGRVCLRLDHIRNRNIPDDRTVVFRMDDGTAWKTTLENPCVGLRIADRFDFVNAEQWVCGGQQRIRVSGGAGGYCFLGNFTRSVYPPKPGAE